MPAAMLTAFEAWPGFSGSALAGAERVLRGFLERRTEGESFAHYVSRAEEAWLL